MQLVVRDDKLHKYREHLQTGLELKGKDKEMFDRFFYAFSQLLDGASERQVVKSLMNAPAPLGGISQSQAYNIINGSQEVFGAIDMADTKKKAKRYIYATRLEEQAARLEQLAADIIDKYGKKTVITEDGMSTMMTNVLVEKEAGILLEKASNILMKAAKIRGLMEKDATVNPNKYKVAPNIIFTDDLGALEVLREIEDADYTEINDNATGDGTEAE